MSYCPHCGQKQDLSSVYCASCGQKIGGAEPMPDQAIAPSKPSAVKSVLKIVLYGVLGIVVAFVGLVGYFMVTDRDVKSETKVTVEKQVPATAAQPDRPVANTNQNQAASKPSGNVPAGVKVTGIEVGYGFDSSKYKVTSPTDALQGSRLDMIHAVIYLEGITAPITAKGEWVYVDGKQSVWTNEVTLPSDGAFHYDLSRPTKGWVPGNYAIKIHVNGKELAWKKFVIQ